MGYDVEQNIGIPLNTEVEAPVTIHPRLPAFRIILLGTERGVLDIIKKKSRLLEECSFDGRRRVGVGTIKVPGGANLHYLCTALRCRLSSLAVRNGALTRPALISLSASARRASITARCLGVSTSSASTIFLGLMTTVLLTWVTSTKSPVCSPRASKISLGITTWRRWPIFPMGMTTPFRSVVRVLLFIPSAYQMRRS